MSCSVICGGVSDLHCVVYSQYCVCGVVWYVCIHNGLLVAHKFEAVYVLLTFDRVERGRRVLHYFNPWELSARWGSKDVASQALATHVWTSLCWFQVKVTRVHVCGPEGGVLLVSADSWQRLFRNRVRHPQDGNLSEALLISDKDSPGPCVRPESARMFTGVLLTFLQWPLRRESHGKRSHEQPSIRRRLWCLHCISGKDLLVSANTVLDVTVLSLWTSICITQWRCVNRIDYLQTDYDVLRRLHVMSQFCGV